MPEYKNVLTKKRRRVMWWVLAITVIPVVALSFIFIATQRYNLSSSVKNDMHEGLRSAAVALMNDFKIVGQFDSENSEFSINDNGDFMQGDFNFSKNRFALDDLKEKANIYCAVVIDGELALTTFDYFNDIVSSQNTEELSEYTEFWNAALEEFEDGKEEILNDDLIIDGEQYYALSMPIEDFEGNNCGVIITAKAAEDVSPMLSSAFRRSLVISSVATFLIF
ncbi:MAG: hypothetical protein K6B15_05060, partial [Parasporobacterium sp.]|nr:hypothetical protein [Parasporobacterium sp.]